MSLPIIGPVIASLYTWLFNFFSVKAMNLGAKVFRKKYPPDIHAKKSRKFMYDNYWKVWQEKAGKSKNKLDDIGTDFVYYYNACWIEDGRMQAILMTIDTAIDSENKTVAKNALAELQKLIEIPKDA